MLGAKCCRQGEFTTISLTDRVLTDGLVEAFRIGCSLPAAELKRDNLAIDACIDGWEVVLPDCFIPKARSVSGPTVVYFEGDLLDGDSAVQSFQFDTLEVAGQSSLAYARRL